MTAFGNQDFPAADRNARPPRRVLIVDDSRTIRALLRNSLQEDPRLLVVGEASDAYEAREKIKQLSPDVITLDVEMPRMNGLDFLAKLMRLRPMPVVMVSNRTRERSAEAIRALSLGAVDCVDVARLQSDPVRRLKLAETLVLAAQAHVRAPAAARSAETAPGGAGYRWNGRVVIVGSSTGGVDALERVLSRFPENGPPVLIAQHMPEAFLKSFALRLNDVVAPRVALAEHGAPVRQGQILLGPGGDRHLSIAPAPGGDTVRLVPSSGEDLYVPSVDRLFASAVPMAPRVAAVVLTGMGRDGAMHLPELRASGARVLAQSGESAVVDGMPRAARETGAVEKSVDVHALGDAILEITSTARARSRGNVT